MLDEDRQDNVLDQYARIASAHEQQLVLSTADEAELTLARREKRKQRMRDADETCTGVFAYLAPNDDREYVPPTDEELTLTHQLNRKYGAPGKPAATASLTETLLGRLRTAPKPQELAS